MFAKWRKRRSCFHHDRSTGVSYITKLFHTDDARALFECGSCRRRWIL